MDSDPEPRSTAPTPDLASPQAEDSPEEPPSSDHSLAIVLGPLIAALTLVVPFAGVIVDRQVGWPAGEPAPRPDLMGGWPALSRPASGGPASGQGSGRAVTRSDASSD